MNFFVKAIQGLFIGAGCIAPGVSGGSLAVIFGLYEKLMDAIATGFKDLKNKIKFLFPVLLGAGIGVLLFSRLIKYLFLNFGFQTKYLFIGLMLGTVPALFKVANKNGFKKLYSIPLAITFIITVLFRYLEAISSSGSSFKGSMDIVSLIIYGVILGFGTIIPGISASFILIYLGVYEKIMDAISNVNLYVLVPAGIGFLLSIFIFAKLINLLFKKAYGVTYYAAIGFVLGSIILIFPGMQKSLIDIFNVLLLISGFIFSYYLSSLKKD